MTPGSLVALALLSAAPPADAGVKKRAEILVEQLGDPDYRDREKAARELLAIGYAAKDAVLAGQKSPDQEISDRCVKLYPAIWRHDLDKRVKRFLDDPDGPIPPALPGAARWLKLAGEGRASRELYAELVQAHPDQMLDVELHPGRVPEVYRQHLRDVYSRVHVRVPGQPPDPRRSALDSEVLLFLFLGAVGDVRPSVMPGTSSSYYYQFLNSAYLRTRLADAEAGAPVRKLYAAWLEKERYSIIMRRGIDIAAQNKVTECIPTVLKVAGDRGVVPLYRASALLGLGRLGTKENLKDLEPFLTDKSPVTVVVVNGEQWSVQMRDVALGAAVHLVGESPADFGFERRPPANLVSLPSYMYYAFQTDEKRDAAHKKWAEWAGKNLKK